MKLLPFSHALRVFRIPCSFSGILIDPVVQSGYIGARQFFFTLDVQLIFMSAFQKILLHAIFMNWEAQMNSRKVFLVPALVLALAGALTGIANAQDTTGPKAEAVKKEVLKLEEEKLKAFQSTGTDKNICPDWVQDNDAENIVHINADGTEDTKAGLIKDLQKQNRILHSLHYGPQHIHVYGDGSNGTTAVTTYSTFDDIEVYGNRTKSEHHAIDVWVKRDGKWWFVVHSVHNLPSPEALKRQAEKTKEN